MIITIGGTVTCLLKNKLRSYRWLWKTVKTAKIAIDAKIASIVKTATIVIDAKIAKIVVIVNIVKNVLVVKNALTVIIVSLVKNALTVKKTSILTTNDVKMRFKRLFILILRALAYADTENFTRTQF